MTVVPFSTKGPTGNPPPPDEPRSLAGRIFDVEDKLRAVEQLATAMSEFLEYVPDTVDRDRANAAQRIAMKLEEATWEVVEEWEAIRKLAWQQEHGDQGVQS